MTLTIKHRGHDLTPEQLDVIVPVINKSLAGRPRGLKWFEREVDKALEAAGCPVPAEDGEKRP